MTKYYNWANYTKIFTVNFFQIEYQICNRTFGLVSFQDKKFSAMFNDMLFNIHLVKMVKQEVSSRINDVDPNPNPKMPMKVSSGLSIQTPNQFSTSITYPRNSL